MSINREYWLKQVAGGLIWGGVGSIYWGLARDSVNIFIAGYLGVLTYGVIWAIAFLFFNGPPRFSERDK